MVAAEDRAQAVPPVHPVLQRDHRGGRADERRDGLGGLRGIVLIDREDDEVGGANRRRVIGRGNASQVQVAIGARKPQALRPQGRQMRAARDEMNILAGGGEARAEIAADAARSHDGDLHGLLAPRRVYESAPCDSAGSSAAISSGANV
jgi:hypothetical protein